MGFEPTRTRACSRSLASRSRRGRLSQSPEGLLDEGLRAYFNISACNALNLRKLDPAGCSSRKDASAAHCRRRELQTRLNGVGTPTKGRRERGEKGRGWVLPGGRSRYPRARRRVVAGCCRRCSGRWLVPMAHSSGRSRPRAHCPKRLGGPALLAACRHTRRRHARSASLWRPTAPSS